MEYSPMDQYWIWLSSVEGLGVKKFYALLSEYEDARSVWDNVGPQMSFIGKSAYTALVQARSERYLYSLFDRLERLNVAAVSRLNDAYPALLGDIYDPPPVIYVRGKLPESSVNTFAIVGSRHATRDGLRAAGEIAQGLARHGVCVVSGMARGVDTAAHQGSLEGGGPTLAVLGCGVDVVYPPENDRLARRIVDEGGALISEYVPGTPPLGGHFPARNRIISALCPGMLLVEGAKGSGAMITVDFAAEQGRDVFVVPGSIYSPMSAEPNRLLLEGATPVLGPWEILEYYRWAARPSAKERSAPEITLDEDERALVEPLRNEEMSFDELAARSGFNSQKLNSLLTRLELRGIIKKAPGGVFRAFV